MSKPHMPHPASYRDPSGFIFSHDGVLFRQVNRVFKNDFDFFLASGAYKEFVDKGWLLPHQQSDVNYTGDPAWYTTLQPVPVPLITYPWEWSFGMLKDAALLTLQLAKAAVWFGFSLKDATPLNIQWLDGKLVFIDTLSFIKSDATQPWIAYRQFCETFLSPLLLMHYSRMPLQPIMVGYPNGIPLQVTRRLLPRRSRFNLPVYLHIHLHGKVSEKQGGRPEKTIASFSKQKMLNLLGNLESLVSGLELKEQQSAWLNYYDEAAGRENYLEVKKEIITRWLNGMSEIVTVADLGANEGEFSLLAAAAGKKVIAADFDPFCIDRLYRQLGKQKISNLQPMLLDLSAPSAAAGTDNQEYASFSDRCNADLLMALALIHHLCIGKSMPAATVARFFARLGERLLLEFVPPEDPKVVLLLAQKSRAYPEYNEIKLLEAFSIYFDLVRKEPVSNSGRQLWLFRKKQS